MTQSEIANEVYRKLYIGSELKVQSKKGINHEKVRTFVSGFYPHFVLTENENGFKECYLYYDLWLMLNGGIPLEARDDELK